MEKYFFSILILSALFLQGCNKNDNTVVGKGEIRYGGHVYQLNEATKTTSEGMPAIIDDVIVSSYTHELHFKSTDNKNIINVRVGSRNIELLSGECFIFSENINTFGNSIQSDIILKLADENDDENLWHSSTKMNLTYTKKGDIFEIELKYVNSESDFFIKWEGTLKEKRK